MRAKIIHDHVGHMYVPIDHVIHPEVVIVVPERNSGLRRYFQNYLNPRGIGRHSHLPKILTRMRQKQMFLLGVQALIYNNESEK